MQWKGPFHIDSVVSVNDYRVRIKGKCKTYHSNLLKKYVARDETDNKEIDVSGSVLKVTGAAIIEFSESTSDDAVDDDNLLELGTCQSKESITDVRYGQQLTLDQQQELQPVISEYKHIFTDLPGTTDLIKHHVNVTCSDPVRSEGRHHHMHPQ